LAPAREIVLDPLAGMTLKTLKHAALTLNFNSIFENLTSLISNNSTSGAEYSESRRR